MYEYKAKLVRCVDGDTVDFDIDLGFAVFVRARTRLVDVDTPERGQKDYKEATEFLKNLIVKARDEEGYNKIRTYNSKLWS